MTKSVDYYLTPTSPWTYLGHARFAGIASRHGVTVAVKPVDYGVIFPQSGGLPLAKRAPQMGITSKFTVATAYYGIAVKPGNLDLLQWVNTWVFVNKNNGDDWSRSEVEMVERVARVAGTLVNLIGERS